MTVDRARLETLIVARLATHDGGLDAEALAKHLGRYAPTRLDGSAWRAEIAAAVRGLVERAVVGDDGALRDAQALERHVGKVATPTWTAMTDRVLPGLALGIAADDAKSQRKLVGRDAWAAAIAARAMGSWREGPPPSPAAVCDAFVWRQLGLGGKAKRVPPEIRALFIQRELATDPASPDRLLRLYAARAVGAPRPDLRMLRDALVQRWLRGEALGAHADTTDASTALRDPEAGVPIVRPMPSDASTTPRAASAGVPAEREPATDASTSPRDGVAFVPTVRALASDAREGVFGDRKVFIASVWTMLRGRPGWDELSLDEFKTQLVSAHRRGELVLARADLVAAMDPALVDASETQTEGASFHFIVREAS